MHKHLFQQFFKGEIWEQFGKKVCTQLKNESVLITSIPEGGQRFFLKFIEEIYPEVTKDFETVFIAFEIIPQQVSIENISSKIATLLKLKIPSLSRYSTCEEILNEAFQLNKRIIIIINRFERLKNYPETMTFLESLRSLNQLSFRFLLSCDISCLLEPEKYNAAGILTSGNIYILPQSNIESIQDMIKTYKHFYNWEVEASSNFAEELFGITGGFPGFIKYVLKYYCNKKPSVLKIEDIVQDSGIKFKIQNLLFKLEENHLVYNSKLNEDKSDILIKLGLLDKDKKITIKLLEYFLKDEKRNEISDIEKKLSQQEFQLYTYFKSHEDKIVTLDEIAPLLWGPYANKKYSLWSIYKVVSNLNKKLHEFNISVKSYRGRGYSLSEKK